MNVHVRTAPGFNLSPWKQSQYVSLAPHMDTAYVWFAPYKDNPYVSFASHRDSCNAQSSIFTISFLIMDFNFMVQRRPQCMNFVHSHSLWGHDVPKACSTPLQFLPQRPSEHPSGLGNPYQLCPSLSWEVYSTLGGGAKYTKCLCGLACKLISFLLAK